jgi:hypothetical protein
MPGGSGGHNVGFALTLIAVGIVLLLKELGYLHGNVLKFWPVILIAWGFGIIWAARKG